MEVRYLQKFGGFGEPGRPDYNNTQHDITTQIKLENEENCCCCLFVVVGCGLWGLGSWVVGRGLQVVVVVVDDVDVDVDIDVDVDVVVVVLVLVLVVVVLVAAAACSCALVSSLVVREQGNTSITTGKMLWSCYKEKVVLGLFVILTKQFFKQMTVIKSNIAPNNERFYLWSISLRVCVCVCVWFCPTKFIDISIQCMYVH